MTGPDIFYKRRRKFQRTDRTPHRPADNAARCINQGIQRAAVDIAKGIGNFLLHLHTGPNPTAFCAFHFNAAIINKAASFKFF